MAYSSLRADQGTKARGGLGLTWNSPDSAVHLAYPESTSQGGLHAPPGIPKSLRNKGDGGEQEHKIPPPSLMNDIPVHPNRHPKAASFLLCPSHTQIRSQAGHAPLPTESKQAGGELILGVGAACRVSPRWPRNSSRMSSPHSGQPQPLGRRWAESQHPSARAGQEEAANKSPAPFGMTSSDAPAP